jgi:hypothetical protein
MNEFGKYPIPAILCNSRGRWRHGISDGNAYYRRTKHGRVGKCHSSRGASQLVLWCIATNESKYPWMDEGFTTYAQNVVLDRLYKQNAANPHARNYGSYFSYVTSDDHEPATTHADFYHTNRAYGISAYSKGAVFLHQLGYIIGEDNLKNGLLRYFSEWGFKHPTPSDFLLVMEKTSGMELDWYLEQFIGTTNTIDYGIREVTPNADGVEVQIGKNWKYAYAN